MRANLRARARRFEAVTDQVATESVGSPGGIGCPCGYKKGMSIGKGSAVLIQ